MSPQIAAEERLRRLAPLAAAVAGLAMGLAPTMPATPSEAQVAAAVLVAVAAGLVAHAIAAARGAPGIVGGAVAGVWLAVVATTGGGVTGDVWAAATLAASAGAATILARASMRAGGDPPIAAAPVAVALVVLEPRAWAVAGAIAALVVLRDRGRRRLLAIPALMAASGAGVVTLLGALDKAPGWAPGAAKIGANAWLEGAVDVLGPLAIVLAAVGVMSVADERRARWLTAAIAAAMAAIVPLGGALASGGVTAVRAGAGQIAQLAPIVPPTALVGAALALGVTVAAAAARVGRPRHQLVAAAAITALMIAPFAL